MTVVVFNTYPIPCLLVALQDHLRQWWSTQLQQLRHTWLPSVQRHSTPNPTPPKPPRAASTTVGGVPLTTRKLMQQQQDSAQPPSITTTGGSSSTPDVTDSSSSSSSDWDAVLDSQSAATTTPTDSPPITTSTLTTSPSTSSSSGTDTPSPVTATGTMLDPFSSSNVDPSQLPVSSSSSSYPSSGVHPSTSATDAPALAAAGDPAAATSLFAGNSGNPYSQGSSDNPYATPASPPADAPTASESGTRGSSTDGSFVVNYGASCTSDADCYSSSSSSSSAAATATAAAAGVDLVCPPPSIVTFASSATSNPTITTTTTSTTASSSSMMYQRACTFRPPGGLYLPSEMTGPVLYYPLTNSSVVSWPAGRFVGLAAGQAEWADDVYFGNASVLMCGPGRN